MHFGLSGFPLGQMRAHLDAPPLDVVTRIARAADDLGFDFVCAQDHIVAPRAWAADGAGETWFDPFVVLSAAAAVTTRVRVLTDVIVLPYRSPFAVAKTAASLDVLSNGRVVLGVAAGYLEQEFQILNAEFAQRGAWTDEAIDAIKHAWTNEWLDFDGRFFTAKDVAVSPRPVQQPHPPIWVGGNSARALRRAVEHADGWTPFRGNPQTLAAMLAEAGAPPGFDVCVPLRRGVYSEDRSAIDVSSIRAQTDALAGAGVTHCKVGFRGPSVYDYLRAMESFATAMIETAS